MGETDFPTGPEETLMATGKRRGKSLAPLSKQAGDEKIREIKEMREAALKGKGNGKVKVK